MHTAFSLSSLFRNIFIFSLFVLIGAVPTAAQTTSTTILVSVKSDGTHPTGYGPSYEPAISANGRFIAFSSSALLVDQQPDCCTRQVYIYVHDQQTSTTTRIPTLNPLLETFIWLDISGDGRYIAYGSSTPQVVGDTNARGDIFVYDRQTGTTTLVSVASDGTQANEGGGVFAISADGRYIAFQSRSTNLVNGDTNGDDDVFVHDRQTGTTTRVSVASDGTQAQSYYGTGNPDISADGRYVAFYSTATNLVSDDLNGDGSDIFVHDRQTGTTTRVSVASNGVEAGGGSWDSKISADGRYVAFRSTANLVNGYQGGQYNIYVHDRQTRVTTLVSVASNGSQGNAESSEPAISADGRYVTFSSAATNLINPDVNGFLEDIFVHDRQTHTTRLVSISSNGIQANETSFTPSISADGRYIGFASRGTNLVSADTSAGEDIFVFSRNGDSLKDSDGDGLPDQWEQNGLDIEGDGTVEVNLPAMGANPMKKDIFVEVDYMVDKGTCILDFCLFAHSHKPKDAAIQKIVQAFANAPVNTNPDGSTGVNLHVDYGPDGVMNPITGQKWGNLSQSNELAHDDDLGTMAGNVYDWAEFQILKDNNFSDSRMAVFHYAIFAHNLGGLGGTSGISRNGANIAGGASDFIVSLGSWADQVGTTNEQAGTFMHELGHNLGLRHGGGDDTLWKPNYLSVMNYSFQTQGLYRNNQNGQFDYSRFTLVNLDETANGAGMNEAIGLNGGTALNSYGTRYYCSINNEKFVANANGGIDWNCDGDKVDIVKNRNINAGYDFAPEAAIDVLRSQNDWDKLIYTGGAIGLLGVTPNLPIQTIAPKEITMEIDNLIYKPFKVYISGPAGAEIGPNKAVSKTISYTIGNGGSNNDTYSITATSTGLGWADLSTIPSIITLASGQTATFNMIINHPAGAIGKEQIKLVVTSQSDSGVGDMILSEFRTINQVYLPIITK